MIKNPIIGQKYWTFLTTWQKFGNNEFGVATDPWEGVLAPDDTYPFRLTNDDYYLGIEIEDLYTTREEAINGGLEAAMDEIAALSKDIKRWRAYANMLETSKKSLRKCQDQLAPKVAEAAV